MEHACRALVTDGVAHLAESLDQTRIGEASIHRNPPLLLLLGKRSELCQKLLWRALARSSSGKGCIKRLFRCGKGSAVIVMIFRCRDAILFSFGWINNEALQTSLIPADCAQLMPTGRAPCQEMAQDP